MRQNVGVSCKCISNIMAESQEQLPEWMLRLENKRKKQHRLAHEIGAGAPCFVCGEGCPGLDLHFWRKLCRNCKCKKEDHDVRDDEGYEQFEILLGPGSRKTKKGGVLKIKVPEDLHSPVACKDAPSKGVSFDWLPPNVTEELAAEYMQKLPASKLPISGSDGALYRRQQLEKQVPLHDLDAKHCHNLTSDEIEQLMKYLENLKNNVVGQGCIGKIPLLPKAGTTLGISHSADAICSLPPMPSVYNSMPRPFHAAVTTGTVNSNDGGDDNLPPPLPTSLPPRADLKTPSEFMPDWKLPDDKVIKDVVGDLQDLNLNMKSGYGVLNQMQAPFISSKHTAHHSDDSEPISGNHVSSKVSSQTLYGEGTDRSYPQYSSVLGISGKPSDKSNPMDMVSNPSFQPSSKLESKEIASHHPANTVELLKKALDPYSDLHKGPSIPSGAVLGNISHDTHGIQPINSVPSAYTYRRDMASSVPFAHKIEPSISKPLQRPEMNIGGNKSQILGENKNAASPENRSGITSFPETENIYQGNKEKMKIGAADQYQQSIAGTLPVDGVLTSSFLPHDVAHSNPVKTDALPKSAHMMQQNTPVITPAVPATVATELAGNSGDLKLDCQECGLEIQGGDIAVFAERAGNAAWHPGCFICSTCKELLVDLMYFHHKGRMYCGRHYAELLGIPRCFACDELIFVNSYTVAEAKAFHVKHFCCYECDDPLAGKKYILVEDQPVCLDCYESKYGKKCHTCNKKIGAGQQRVEWKHLNWHVEGNCFHCFECSKSLLGGRFVVKENQPFCSKECVHVGLPKLTRTI